MTRDYIPQHSEQVQRSMRLRWCAWCNEHRDMKGGRFVGTLWKCAGHQRKETKCAS